MHILVIALLAVVQGAAELLPISSSAHVILLEKIFGLDPTSPEMTFLLVMLHTGTMIAVLVYFWSRWLRLLSKQNKERWTFVWMLISATIATGVVGLGLQVVIEHFVLGGTSGAAVENLFGNSWIIATGLAAVGVLIISAGFLPGSAEKPPRPKSATSRAVLIGAVQGLALPFRGFSRSGSTISVGLLTGLSRRYSEEFSFALAVILTIPVVGREALRLRHLSPGSSPALTTFPVLTGIIGMVLSFAAGLVAIRWLSAWLEKGRWGYFGFYCLALSAVIFVLAGTGVIA
ncbi:MAG: undecaprenyl-diphosphate phosphatase [Spirochaetia bacterium]|jgi:undecaprenyl-diphosphatase